ncbi:hypothetical protein N0V93_000500 [Gnomoniopsis smithogilvyi]|uniref:AHC1-like C2H2 zinc-finger domain-containing protein n=1 Tax=Gnomoniopsis smithogilvyi TaxID=1191159 RepID=A0A9W8YZS9_9PEZI|nr:hypothetical protein N0V93_000500 [Gnomoniopsis smithogilvyi]
MPNQQDALTLATSPRALKRKASDCDEEFEDVKDAGAKRPRVEYSVATPPETPSASSLRPEYFSPSPVTAKVSSEQTDHIADIVNEHFGQEILLRHQELRFINQELAKCQAALEQLRRCHLIPYPTACPTPQQMLDIVDGSVPAVQSKTGGPSPQWAPPYGVVDGPYARHYAKWLIPDPKFDGQIPEWVQMSEATRSVEGRSTRNSVVSLPEGTTIGKRIARGQCGQKLPSTIPAAPKTKGPCILKRNDGVMVKLVCFGCQREDFSSTQGFINHVRISHSAELKSHEEAAIRCGQPIDDSEIAAPVVEEKASAAQASAAQVTTGTVHPLARTDATAEQNALARILQNIDSSLKLFHQGKLPEVTSVPSMSSQPDFADVDSKPSKSFVGSSATPFLSHLLQGRNFKGDLLAHVEDAKTKVDLDDYIGEDDVDDGEQQAGHSQEVERAKNTITSVGARIPVPATLGPARAVPSPVAGPEQHQSTMKSRSTHLSLDPTASRLSALASSSNDEDGPSVGDLNVMDEHSPSTAISNSAPSLTSDDGGDDSDDDASSSDASDADALEEDITEVNPEFHEDHLVQHAAGTSSGTQKKDDSKHVTFVTPVPGKASSGVRRKANV